MTAEKRITIQDLRDIIAREQSSVTTHVAPWVWALIICGVLLFKNTPLVGMILITVIIFGSLIPLVIAALWLAVWIKDRTSAAGSRLASKLGRR